MDIETLLMLAFGEDDRGMVVVIRNKGTEGTSGQWASKGVDVSNLQAAVVLEAIAKQFREAAAKKKDPS